MKKRLWIVSLLLVAVGVMACSDEDFESEATRGEDAIERQGQDSEDDEEEGEEEAFEDEEDESLSSEEQALIDAVSQQEPFASVLPLYPSYVAFAEIEGSEAFVEFIAEDPEEETDGETIGYAYFEGTDRSQPTEAVATTPEQRQAAEQALASALQAPDAPELLANAPSTYVIFPVEASLWEAVFFNPQTERETLFALFDATTGEILEVEAITEDGQEE